VNAEFITAIIVIVISIFITLWVSELRWRKRRDEQKRAYEPKHSGHLVNKDLSPHTAKFNNVLNPENRNKYLEKSMKDFLMNITKGMYQGNYIVESVAIAIQEIRNIIIAEETDSEKRSEKLSVAYKTSIKILGAIFEISSMQEEIYLMAYLNKINNPNS
jgi:hypothetical protein